MRKDSQISLLVSAGAAITGLLVVGYYASFLFQDDDQELACGLAAPSVLQMNLVGASGEIMSPIELQTELGMNSLGVMDRARVVETGQTSPDIALEVNLPKDSTSPFNSATQAGGIAYEWSPRGLSKSRSACLRYAVMLPENFKPGNGGVLPGLFGGTLLPIGDEPDGKNGFAAHTIWRDDGKLAIHAQIPPTTKSNRAIINRAKFDMDAGRWVWIDQYVKLNTPGEHDGSLKLWVDGKLVYRNNEVAWRTDDSLRFQGASGSVYYGTPKRASNAPEAAVILISPFQLSWSE